MDNRSYGWLGTPSMVGYSSIGMWNNGILLVGSNPRQKTAQPLQLKTLGHGICGSFFLLLSFSSSQDVNFFLIENIIIWVKTLRYFTQMMIFSFDTSFWMKKGVIWWLFIDDLRAR